MASVMAGLLVDLVDGYAFAGVPVARVALGVAAHVYDKKKGTGGQEGSLDPNSIEGRINYAMSRGDFAGAVRQVQESDLPSYTKDRVLDEIERIKQGVIDQIRQREAWNTEIRRLIRRGDYGSAIDFVKRLDVPKDNKKSIVAALKEDRSHRRERQAFGDAVRHGEFTEARSALARVPQWNEKKKAAYGLLLQELERLRYGGATDRDYGRAIGQVGQLNLTRAERKDRIRELEAARREAPDKERLVQALAYGNFDVVRTIADSLSEWPGAFKQAFRVFIDDIESVTPD